MTTRKTAAKKRTTTKKRVTPKKATTRRPAFQDQEEFPGPDEALARVDDDADAQLLDYEDAEEEDDQVEALVDQEPRIHQAVEPVDGEFDDGTLNDGWPADWSPSRKLDAPPPREGMTQRWVRMDYMDGKELDTANLTSTYQAGWHPRPAHTVAHEYMSLKMKVDDFGDVVVANGMVLCEMPLRLARQRNEHYRRMTQLQDQAIQENVRSVENPILGPIDQERSSQTQIGRRPQIADD